MNQPILQGLYLSLLDDVAEAIGASSPAALQAFADEPDNGALVRRFIVEGDAPVAATLLAIYMRLWQSTGPENAITVHTLMDGHDWAERDPPCRVAFGVASVLEALAQIAQGNETVDVVDDLLAAFDGIATDLAALGHQGVAAAVVLARNDAAHRLGRQAPAHDELDGHVRSIKQAITAAFDGQAGWLDALDTCERLLRHLPEQEDKLLEGITFLYSAAHHPELAPLKGWVGLAMSGVDSVLEVEDPRLYLPVEFPGTSEAYFRDIKQIVKAVQLNEDGRLVLERTARGATRSIDDQVIVADWNTFSFRHGAFHHAIPNAGSFYREANFHELLLVMRHELTHIHCMASGIGIAMLALRMAIARTELDLVADTVQASGREWVADGPAPRPMRPDAVTPLALADAEKSLVLLQKLAMLEDTWAAWLEGVAVFEELASYPGDDPIAHTVTVPVMTNFVDRRPEGNDEATMTAWVFERMGELEQHYENAADEKGQARLVAYLLGCGQTYLAGYLAVRRVVASWRQTLGTGISGAHASRLLLHFTRLRSVEALPDLGLDAPTFRTQALERQMSWIRALAALPREALEHALDIEASAQDVGIDENGIDHLCEQAYASLGGERANADRVAGTTWQCRAMMDAVATALPHRKFRNGVVDGLISRHLSCLSLLTIGEVDAPFWLVEDGRWLSVLLRTTECHHQHGTPSYNTFSFLLAEHEYEALQHEVRSGRHARMSVFRMADLVPGQKVEDRGAGRHVLHFRCGTWSKTLPCGLWLGWNEVAASLEHAAMLRTTDNPVVAFERDVTTPAFVARMTAEWLDRCADASIEVLQYELDAWVDHVRALANDVLAYDPARCRGDVALALLQLVLDDADQARNVFDRGLRALAAPTGASATACIRLLRLSARSPCSDPAIADEAKFWRGLFRYTEQGVDVGAFQGDER